jgi:hypothetical protein
MSSDRISHPLTGLHDKNLDDFKLHLGEVKQLRLSGWKGFKLYLRNTLGTISSSLVVKGIYSSGGKDGIQPWMDLEYWEEVDFVEKRGHPIKFTLSSSGQDVKLFGYLGKLIPPGGHLMVSYEAEQKIHTDTVASLSLGIPAVVTPLGHLLFKQDFQYIKDWYLAEGGFEGPRKLWGEKAPDDDWRLNYLKRTALEIDTFLKKKFSSSYGDLVDPAQKRAIEIREIIQKNR